ncbi:protein YIPF4-like isoform X2 [Tachypleus tridentatus]|uniref:protein YIPF4-like isoform X2 n=1 Tax=Tachypleus tridentatus TaxID=6853 RepID=UPI003FD6A193
MLVFELTCSDSSGSHTSSSYIKIGMEGVETYTCSEDFSSGLTTPQNIQSETNMPSNFEDFSFVSSTSSAADLKGLSGSLDSLNPQGSVKYRRKNNVPGAAFFEQHGFGWLVEEDSTDREEEDKPLLEELEIDPRDILYKVRCVLCPFPFLGYQRQLVRDSPDFWGPLFVVIVFALVSLYGQATVVSWIMTLWVCGSLLVFLLARVLGGEVNYSQCLGVIGYSVLPLIITATTLPLLNPFPFISLFVKLMGVVWATYSAGSLLCVQELQNKRPLLLYPIFLLYVYFFSLYSGV